MKLTANSPEMIQLWRKICVAAGFAHELLLVSFGVATNQPAARQALRRIFQQQRNCAGFGDVDQGVVSYVHRDRIMAIQTFRTLLVSANDTPRYQRSSTFVITAVEAAAVTSSFRAEALSFSAAASPQAVIDVCVVIGDQRSGTWLCRER